MARRLTAAQRKALVADLASGMTQSEVARKYGVGSSTANAYAKRAGILPPCKASPKRGRCMDCSAPTTKRDGVCQACTRVRKGRQDPIALTGGEWVYDPDRRVMVYRAA